jgi:predicted MFS family arabinose efflux permease
LEAVTLILLAAGHELWAVAPVMIAWGALNSAIPVAWSAWLTKGIADEPESGGGLMVGSIQLSIMIGAALGGSLLDRFSIAATLIGGAILLVAATLTVGDGSRINARIEDPVTRKRLIRSDSRTQLEASEQCS